MIVPNVWLGLYNIVCGNDMHRGPDDSDIPSCGGLVDGCMDSSSLAPMYLHAAIIAQS